MNDDSHTKLHLENFLPYRFDYLAKRMSKAVSAIYATHFGITVPEWRVSAFLAEQPGLTSSALCKLSLMDKVKVSRAVRGLREKGWINEVIDSNDNRAKYLTLSELGLKNYGEISPKVRAWELDLVNVLKASEYKELLSAMDKLSSELDTISDRKTDPEH